MERKVKWENLLIHKPSPRGDDSKKKLTIIKTMIQHETFSSENRFRTGSGTGFSESLQPYRSSSLGLLDDSSENKLSGSGSLVLEMHGASGSFQKRLRKKEKVAQP